MASEVRAAIIDFLRSHRFMSYLITTQRDGRPYSTRVAALFDETLVARIASLTRALKATHIRNNPSVGLLLVELTEQPGWDSIRNVYLQGDAEVITDSASVDRLVADYAAVGTNLPPRPPGERAALTIRPRSLRAEGFYPERFTKPYLERILI